jgi:ATP-dependent Clp protease ATP-binding subunit ClpA
MTAVPSRNLEDTINRAIDFATERRHEFVTLEHLLLALAEDQDATCPTTWTTTWTT